MKEITMPEVLLPVLPMLLSASVPVYAAAEAAQIQMIAELGNPFKEKER